MRWRKLPPGRVKSETLKVAKKAGVLIRRSLRRINRLERGTPKRTDYYRQQKAARRAQLQLEGGATISFRLTADEQKFFVRCFEKQRGNPETFHKRAFLAGCAFVANSGGRKNDQPKTKIKNNEIPKITAPKH